MAFDLDEMYRAARHHQPPGLKAKHIRQFDAEFWRAGECRTDHRVLEIGCGNGLFLSYLERKGVTDFVGLDVDDGVLSVLPSSLRPRVQIADAAAYLAAGHVAPPFDRIVAFDVLEHLTVEDGIALLRLAGARLNPGGRIVLRLPNVTSPLGLRNTFDSFNHRTVYGPGRIGEAADAAGLRCLACLPQKRRRGPRRLMEDGLCWALSRMLTAPPVIWTDNFIAVLAPADLARLPS